MSIVIVDSYIDMLVVPFPYSQSKTHFVAIHFVAIRWITHSVVLLDVVGAVGVAMHFVLHFAIHFAIRFAFHFVAASHWGTQCILLR